MASRRRVHFLLVSVVLFVQTALLGYSATVHSPTYLEPAFLAAGVSHWTLGRFELYRVNPPFPRMVAALPVVAIGCKTDWSSYREGPGSRSERYVGIDFLRSNGPRSQYLFILARWACIPFNLLGSIFAYRWAKELYGSSAGLLALTLYAFEPNLLSHGELVTPDCACTAFGVMAGFCYWRWLKAQTWRAAIAAGITLGLAELTKFTWIILFALWPILWLAWRLLQSPDTSAANTPQKVLWNTAQSGVQLAGIMCMALLVLNLGYGFDEVGTPQGQRT